MDSVPNLFVLNSLKRAKREIRVKCFLFKADYIHVLLHLGKEDVLLLKSRCFHINQ